MTRPDSMDYRSAGVDLEKADRAKEGIRSLVAATRDRNTLSEMGSFGGLYAVPDDVPDPVLVSSADGVGTKLKVAFMTGVHDTVGRDLVNHCVNDILVQGARPLFFLDYLATGELEEGVVEGVVRGVAEACRENGCALLGGETAQMPDFYGPGEYDLAGFIVGIVSRDRILDGSRVREGDVLLGLPSSGLHTNGYTLARKIVFEAAELEAGDSMPGLGAEDAFPGAEDAFSGADDAFPGAEDAQGAAGERRSAGTPETVGQALLRIHRTYLPVLEEELERKSLRALAHITGGGIPGNLPRSLPEGLGARILRDSWRVPPLFRALRELGNVTEDEMFRVFNMGVGMVLVVSEAEAAGVVERLRTRGEVAWRLGRVTPGEGVRFV